MTIPVLSDLHIERKPFSDKRAGGRAYDEAEIVVLAGNIHEGIKRLRWAVETLREVEPDGLTAELQHKVTVVLRHCPPAIRLQNCVA